MGKSSWFYIFNLFCISDVSTVRYFIMVWKWVNQHQQEVIYLWRLYSTQSKTKVVTKVPHPEMTDVKNGDELLVVNFGEEENKRSLLQSLEDRISELEDEDQDEGDGDIIVRI